MNNQPVTKQEYMETSKRLLARAAKYRANMRAIMFRYMKEAGVGHVMHLHNAWVAKEKGRPWPNVDYAALRKARRAYARTMKAHTLVNAYLSKLYDRTQ